MKTPANRKEQGHMNSGVTVRHLNQMKAQVSAVKQSCPERSRRIVLLNIIAAHKYVSPRARPLTHEETEVRRIAYALKVPTVEACELAARDLAPLIDAHEAPDTHLVLMPVPSSTGSTEANRQFANELAAEIHRRYPERRVQVKITVGRKHPVESSCVRRKRGLFGLQGEEHAFIRLAGWLTATGTAYYFVDNMATTGATIAACRSALGFGDGIVWADKGLSPRSQSV
jgi:predicted amidophosphoribosyltransferase